MTSRRPLESDSLDSLLSAARELVQQLENVRSAGTHHERAPGRRRRRATQEQSVDKTRFTAIFRAISEKALAYIKKLEEQELHGQETHEETPAESQEETHAETHEQTPAAPHEEIHAETPEQTPERHQGLSECNAKASNLRFPCNLAQLGKNMVATIQEALLKLVPQDVNDRGYLILDVQETWDALELTKLLRSAKAPGCDEIKGFKLARGASDCLHAQVTRDISLSLPNFEGFSEARMSPQPEIEFEEWIANPPACVQYLICEPLSDHAVNRLLDAGSQCNHRPKIPGVNRPYWYISGEPNTPATLHIEDGNTGSANLLLAGAEKHWIIIPRSSADKLESCIREQFPASKSCSQFLRHHDVIVGPCWLEARGIPYEIVCQKPGDLLVTLPGRVYHEVRNTGKNFAMAINYELQDAPNEPANYV